MAHVLHNKHKLLSRVRRIQGQTTALEKALISDTECSAVLTQIAAVRGAVQGLMIEVLDDHLREHLAAEEDLALRNEEVVLVMSLLRSYFK
ncbi:MAG: metal/formaldehyde-sensitive transcriptional repressor [Lysobacterales bacterium]